MKTSRKRTRSADADSGFTLIELLVVMAIIAILATLSLGGFSYAQTAAARNKSTASLSAIKAGLEAYKDKFGEYPKATSPSDHSLTFTPGIGAQMLYQAISGDGSDAIDLGSGGGGAGSDGAVDATERENSINSSLPPAIIYPPQRTLPIGSSGARYMIDGFGQPFQYSKAESAGAINTINPTYDLWSYGKIDSNSGAPSGDLATKKSSDSTAKWIKNW